LLYARFPLGSAGAGLLEEALAALPPGDSALRSRLLAHLALEMWSGFEPVERRVAISEEAIAMARRLGRRGKRCSRACTPATGAHQSRTERASGSRTRTRCFGFRRRASIPRPSSWRTTRALHCYLELCDRWGAETETQAMTGDRRAGPTALPPLAHGVLRTTGATLDGRFADSERLAQEALELAQLLQSEYTTYVSRYAQMVSIRWAQGRLDEFWPEIQDHGERFPWIPRWRDALAAAELGDEEAARRELERHGARGFAELPRDGNWMVHVCSLADACVLVGDDRRAAQLYELLLPHGGDNAVTYSKQPFGPVALRLGKLAALLERWDGRRSGTSRLRSSAASGSARGRSAPACCSSTPARWPRAARRRPRTHRRDARRGGGSVRTSSA
jgi:hypothetical protein